MSGERNPGKTVRTPSGRLSVELDENDFAFLNALYGILPGAPEFHRAVPWAVGDAVQVIPFDLFAVTRGSRGGPQVTMFAPGTVASTFLNAARAEMEQACPAAIEADAASAGAEVEIVQLPGQGRAQEAVEVGSSYVYAAEAEPLLLCGIFASGRDAFQRKHKLLLSVVTTWLRAHTSFTTAYRQMEEMSFTDPLTGCCNRRKFDNEAEREVERVRRYGYDLCLAMVDVDDLKRINDAHGHGTGDAVLRALAEAFSRRLRRVDLVARYGGDEFVVLLPHTPIAGAVLALSRVLGDCRDLAAGRDDRRQPFSASVGVATYRKGDSVESLVHRADSGLYAAKKDRRGTVVVAG